MVDEALARDAGGVRPGVVPAGAGGGRPGHGGAPGGGGAAAVHLRPLAVPRPRPACRPPRPDSAARDRAGGGGGAGRGPAPAGRLGEFRSRRRRTRGRAAVPSRWRWPPSSVPPWCGRSGPPTPVPARSRWPHATWRRAASPAPAWTPVRCLVSSWPRAVGWSRCPARLRGRVDLVVSNPPYVAESEWAGLAAEVRAEPRSALVAGPGRSGVGRSGRRGGRARRGSSLARPARGGRRRAGAAPGRPGAAPGAATQVRRGTGRAWT